MKLPKFSIRDKIRELESQVVVPVMREVYQVNMDGRTTTYLNKADADAEAHTAALYAARQAEKDFYEHQLVNAPKLEIPIKLFENGYRTNELNRKLALCFVKTAAEAKAFELSRKPGGRRRHREHCPLIPMKGGRNRVMMYWVDPDNRYWREHTSGPYKLCEPTVTGIERAINLIIFDVEGNRVTAHQEGAAFPEGIPVDDFKVEALFNKTELMIRGMKIGTSSRLPYRLPIPTRTLTAAWLKAHVPDYKDPFLAITPPAGNTEPGA